MMWLWIVAGGTLVLAAGGWVVARRTARRVAQLTDMYWQLRYDFTELRARLDREAPASTAEPRTPPGTQFVPLTQVKR